ncbi:MAG: AsmA family protein [Candidatus Hydrogenedentota bacterium]
MKKFIILVIVLLVIAAGALMYAVSRASDIVTEYKPELERMASEALGSMVTLGDLTASIFPKASVIVDSARVANPDNPEEAITVENVSLNLELFPLLTGNIVITSLRVINPTIVMSLEEEGIFIEGLARPQADATSTPAEKTDESPASEPAATASTDVPVTVDLKSFTIFGASITVNDKIADATYTVDDLSLDASLQFAMNQVHLSKVSGDGVLMDVSDFSYTCDTIRYGLNDGTIGLDSLQPQIGESYVLMSGDLNLTDTSKVLFIASDNIVVDDFRELLDIFAPALNEFGVTGLIEPNLEFVLTPTGYKMDGTMAVSGFSAAVEDLIGIDALAGTFTIDATETLMTISTESLQGTMNGAPMTIAMTAALDPETGNVKPLTVTAFGGESTVNTTLTLTDETFPFESQLDTSGMLIEELIPAFAPDMPFGVTGTIKSIKGNVSGTLDDNMMPSLKGESTVLIGDGLIKDVNLGEQVLGAIGDLPFLSGVLLDMVPDGLMTYLNQPHTVLQEVSGTFALYDELIHTEDMKVVSDFFMFEAVGTIGLDTNLDLDSTLRFHPDFSADMVGEVKELSALLDDQGRLSFPVKITGIPPELSTVPDVSGVLGAVVQNEAEKLLEERLGEELNNSPVGETIRGGIKSLFGGGKKKKE